MSTASEHIIRHTAGRSRWLAGAAVGAVMVVAAACSSGAATPSTTTSGAGSGSTKSASTGQNGAAVVTTAKVGSVGTVLVNGGGMTLYRYTPDGTGKSVCTGSCAALWPPLTVPAGTTHVTGGPGVTSADLGTVTRSDGTLQVTYKGMPLYTYVSDAKAGQDSGQGLDGTWFVVSTSGSASGSASGSTGASTPSTTKAASAGGYGY